MPDFHPMLCCYFFEGLPVVQVRPMLYSVSGTTRCSSRTHVVFCFRDYLLFESDPCCIVSGTTRCSSQTHVVFCFRDYPLFESDPCCVLFQGLPVVQVRPMLCTVSGTTCCSSQTHVVFCFRYYPLFESDACCVLF